jgi:protease IV
MELRPGWTFLGILKNMFFLLLFLQVLPLFISGIKNNINQVVHDKTEVGYMHLRGFIGDSFSFTKQLEAFEKNDAIKGLVLKIDSPGGYPASSQAIYRELVRFKTTKPVVAFTENVCASGAYYAASAANKVIANPSSLMGSIGALMKAPNFKEFLDTWKIKNVSIQSGEYKTAMDPFSELKPAELAYLQALTDDCYDQFITDVAEQRGLSKETHKAWANGKIFTGNQALKLKLVDELGTYRDAIAAMATLLKVKPVEVKLISGRKPVQGLMKLVAGDDDEYGAEMRTPLASSVASFCVDVYRKITVQLGAEQPELRA